MLNSINLNILYISLIWTNIKIKDDILNIYVCMSG